AKIGCDRRSHRGTGSCRTRAWPSRTSLRFVIGSCNPRSSMLPHASSLAASRLVYPAAATRAPRCSRTRALDVTLRGVLLASLATEGSSPRSRAEYRHAQSSRGMLLHLARWLRRRAPADLAEPARGGWYGPAPVALPHAHAATKPAREGRRRDGHRRRLRCPRLRERRRVDPRAQHVQPAPRPLDGSRLEGLRSE